MSVSGCRLGRFLFSSGAGTEKEEARKKNALAEEKKAVSCLHTEKH